MAVGRGVIEFRDLNTGERTKQLKVADDWLTAIGLSFDAKTIAITTYKGTVQCYGIALANERWSVSDKKLAGAKLAYSPDGTLLAVTAHDAVRILCADTGKTVAQWPMLLPSMVAFSAEGKTLLASGEYSAALRFWNTASGKEIIRCPGHQGRIAKLAFAGDGERVFPPRSRIKRFALG